MRRQARVLREALTSMDHGKIGEDQDFLVPVVLRVRERTEQRAWERAEALHLPLDAEKRVRVERVYQGTNSAQ